MLYLNLDLLWRLGESGSYASFELPVKRQTLISKLVKRWTPELVRQGFNATDTDNGDDFPFAMRFEKSLGDRTFVLRLAFQNKTVSAAMQGIVTFPALQKGLPQYMQSLTTAGALLNFGSTAASDFDVIEPFFWDGVEDQIFPLFSRCTGWEWFDQFDPDELRNLARSKDRLFISNRSQCAVFFARLHLSRSRYVVAEAYANTGLAIEGMFTTRCFDDEFREIIRACQAAHREA